MAVIGFFVTVCLGLFFYWLRFRWQLVYGLVELVVALAVIFLTFCPQNPIYLAVNAGPSLWGWLLSKSVGASAGIYVMVRGLDNIHNGLPPKWRCKWDRILHAYRDT
jgi:hypothetical protein